MGFTRRGSVRTSVLEIAYEEAGPADGPVAVLSHGFPYDVRAYDDVADVLAASGMRVIAPYLRGYGPTRFTDAATMRSGEQAALARTCSTSSTPSASSVPSSAATTGADAPRASSPRCIRRG